MTPEQRYLIKQNLLRSFSAHELADMLIDKMTEKKINESLEILEDK